MANPNRLNIEFDNYSDPVRMEETIIGRSIIGGEDYTVGVNISATEIMMRHTHKSAMNYHMREIEHRLLEKYREHAVKIAMLNPNPPTVTMTTASASVATTMTIANLDVARDMVAPSIYQYDTTAGTTPLLTPEIYRTFSTEMVGAWRTSMNEYALDYQVTMNRATIQTVDNLMFGHYEGWSIYQNPDETEEEKFTREWNSLLYEKQSANRTLYKVAAENRSLELLVRSLSTAQLKRFEEDKCIPVDGPSGESYLIKPARAINIEVVGKNHRLCAGIPAYNIPMYDNMLAQKLMLESDERRFLEVAIVHG